MSYSKLRKNDFFKYGVELPLTFAAAVNLVTDASTAVVIPVALSAISAYGEQSGRGNEFSRLFNLAAGVLCGVGVGVGLDQAVGENSLNIQSYVVNTATDTLAALSAYTGIRLIGKSQKPSI